MASRIEDYAMLGDCETSALVARDGSVDWLCWPRFDSGACFAALLGEPKNGRWLIGPVRPLGEPIRRYRENTLILETDHETADGAVTDGVILMGLSAEDFRILDAYEEVPHLYTREIIEAATSDGLVRCWVYMPTSALIA